jgi:predicted nuclease of restriction endonuclease-like (RecB) superfamily
MLKSIDKQSVKDDAQKNMNLEQLGPESFIRNLYILEFLELKD